MASAQIYPDSTKGYAQATEPVRFTVNGGPKGYPLLGMLLHVKRDPIGVLADNALRYGDIIPIPMLGLKSIQINHPDLVRHVLMENHRNYQKSDVYIRFESVLGQGLLTSNGDKWKRDRQKIQPMFKREQVEGYFFDVINHVAERYKQRWWKLTQDGAAEIDITREMATLTIEFILKSIFGKDNMDDATIARIHHSFVIFIDYLKDMRLLPKVDMRKLLHMPAYQQFNRELMALHDIVNGLIAQYRDGALTDKYNLLALLYEAQKQDPDAMTDKDIMDHTLTMVFGGFESTSILMQWMWHVLDGRPDIVKKLRDDITGTAPCTAQMDSMGLTYDEAMKMDYLNSFFFESMRLYPPFWVSSRQPLEDDIIGDYKVSKDTVVVVPQIVMHRHPKWWQEPNAFIPERFTAGKGAKIDHGLYFPFSHGPRKCMGYKLVEMEAMVIFAKLLPFFNVKALNVLGNPIDPGISLKLKHPLRVSISRA
jgi:cytochrome P450